MDEIWTRLETFLKQNAPEVYGSLAPGATEAEIADAAAACGVTFPPVVRQSYLRHDGQNDARYCFIPGFFSLLSALETADNWKNNIADLEILAGELRGGGASPSVQPVTLDAGWVPFAWNVGGNQICLDYAPTKIGSIGQIVEYDHEADGQQLLAPDFKTWLGGIVSELESGRLVWNEELTGYCYPEDL